MLLDGACPGHPIRQRSVAPCYIATRRPRVLTAVIADTASEYALFADGSWTISVFPVLRSARPIRHGLPRGEGPRFWDSYRSADPGAVQRGPEARSARRRGLPCNGSPGFGSPEPSRQLQGRKVHAGDTPMLRPSICGRLKGCFGCGQVLAAMSVDSWHVRSRCVVDINMSEKCKYVFCRGFGESVDPVWGNQRRVSGAGGTRGVSVQDSPRA